MTTGRTQNQSQTGKGNNDIGELIGTTEDGDEVSATLDDDEGGVSDGQSMQGNQGSQRGGSGNFANDRERASKEGRKGGRN